MKLYCALFKRDAIQIPNNLHVMETPLGAVKYNTTISRRQRCVYVALKLRICQQCVVTLSEPFWLAKQKAIILA